MTKELYDIALSYAKRRYPNIKDIADDIVNDVFEEFYKGKFKPGKHSKEEWGWIIQCTYFGILNYFNKNNIKTGTVEKLDENTGEIIITEVFTKMIPVDFSTNLAIYRLDDENSECSLSLVENFKNDEEYKCTLEALSIPDNTAKEDEKDYNFRQKLIMKNNDYYGEEIGRFLDRYYLLKERVEYDGTCIPNYRAVPDIKKVGSFFKKSTGKAFERIPTDFILQRCKMLKNFTERYYMEMCMNLLKKGIEQFDKEIEQGHFTEKDREKTPMLSAVAVDKDGKLINSCYKGQIWSCKNEERHCAAEKVKSCKKGDITCKQYRRTFEKHCEYSLLEEVIILEEDKERLKGGALFVTLEPCIKRGTYGDAHGNKNKKVPCAVRCLASGISKIYIGMFDTSKKVMLNGENIGIEILKTGKYTFEFDKSRQHKADEYDGDDGEKKRDIIGSQGSLYNEFKEKYKLDEKESNIEKEVYIIRDGGLYPEGFDEDLIKEVCELNRVFLEQNENIKIFV